MSKKEMVQINHVYVAIHTRWTRITDTLYQTHTVHKLTFHIVCSVLLTKFRKSICVCWTLSKYCNGPSLTSYRMTHYSTTVTNL